MFIVGLSFMLLVIAGEVFNLLETQRWAGQLRSFNADLEQTVAKRTSQLSALHQLTKAINKTLKVNQVVDAAAHHSAQALQSDVVIFWLQNQQVNVVPQLKIYPEGAWTISLRS